MAGADFRLAAALLLFCTYFIFSQGIVESRKRLTGDGGRGRIAGSKVYLLFPVTSAFLFPFSSSSAIRCYVCDNTANPDTCEMYPGSVSNGNKECVVGDFCYTSKTDTFLEGEPKRKMSASSASSHAFFPHAGHIGSSARSRILLHIHCSLPFPLSLFDDDDDERHQHKPVTSVID